MKVRIKHFDYVTEGDKCLTDVSTVVGKEEDPISETLKEYIKARRTIELNEEKLYSCQEVIEEFMSENDIESIECETKNRDGRFANLTVTDRCNECKKDTCDTPRYFNINDFRENEPELYEILCHEYPVTPCCIPYEFDMTYGTEIITNND